jgi:hypothetical protein
MSGWFDTHTGPLAQIVTPQLFIEWDWTDWVGACLFLLVAALVVTGGIALIRGANPLRVMSEFGKAVRTTLRIRSH